MTAHELYDDIMAHLDTQDDAYVERVANDINALTPEGFLEFLSHFDGEKWRAAPLEQKNGFAKLNQALAKKPAFNEAIKRYHDSKVANEEKAP